MSALLIRSSQQLDCLLSAITNSTCAPTDTTCICANAALQGQASQCVVESCTVREQLSMPTSPSSLSSFTVNLAWILSLTALARIATLNITNAECGIFSGHDRSWVPPMIFFIVFAGIIFVLRLVSRVVCHTKLWWDDFFNLLATVSFLIKHARFISTKAPNSSASRLAVLDTLLFAS